VPLINVKYLHLKFTISILHDCWLPREKTSALTGALLSKLKKLYCINRNNSIGCGECKTRNVCLLYGMMGDGYDKNMPIALQSKVSPRFIINCHDSRTVFKANDVLEFEVIAIGNLAELFIHYIYAFESIGQKGLGPEKAMYELLSVLDEKGKAIYGNAVLIPDAAATDIYTYISTRINHCLDNQENIKRMTLLSSIMLNVNCENNNEIVLFSAEAIGRSIKERLSRLKLLEKEDDEKLNELMNNYRIINSINLRLAKTKYHLTNGQKTMIFPRFTGWIAFDNDGINPYLEYFLACEKLCIGRNILLGYGRYIMG